jgi:hypothetical protein
MQTIKAGMILFVLCCAAVAQEAVVTPQMAPPMSM